MVERWPPPDKQDQISSSAHIATRYTSNQVRQHPAGIQKMANRLQAGQKEELIKLIRSDGKIPYKYIPLLFPDGDGTFGPREEQFSKQFHRLEGNSWTSFARRDLAAGIPVTNDQAAWPWRREIWHVHYGCRISLERAYRNYREGHYSDSNEFNEISRILIRYAHFVGALTLHNALEDRIAHLTNAFSRSPLLVEDVNFYKVFNQQNQAVNSLSQTRELANGIMADKDWNRIHDLANEAKHRWTGEFVPHLPKPQEIQANPVVQAGGYVQFSLAIMNGSFLPPDWKSAKPSVSPDADPMKRIMTEQEEKAMANLDGICILAQKSHNLLVDLALQLDHEIDWPSRGLG